jgi:hypothetical protein
MLAYQLERRSLSQNAVLELAVSVSELQMQSFSPQEGFLLSRINGIYTLGEILAMVPGSALENRVMIANLHDRGIVNLKAPAKEPAVDESTDVGL